MKVLYLKKKNYIYIYRERERERERETYEYEFLEEQWDWQMREPNNEFSTEPICIGGEKIVSLCESDKQLIAVWHIR